MLKLLHIWLGFSTDQAWTHSYASLRQGEGLLRLQGQGGKEILSLHSFNHSEEVKNKLTDSHEDMP